MMTFITYSFVFLVHVTYKCVHLCTTILLCNDYLISINDFRNQVIPIGICSMKENIFILCVSVCVCVIYEWWFDELNWLL